MDSNAPATAPAMFSFFIRFGSPPQKSAGTIPISGAAANVLLTVIPSTVTSQQQPSELGGEPLTRRSARWLTLIKVAAIGVCQNLQSFEGAPRRVACAALDDRRGRNRLAIIVSNAERSAMTTNNREVGGFRGSGHTAFQAHCGFGRERRYPTSRNEHPPPKLSRRSHFGARRLQVNPVVILILVLFHTRRIAHKGLANSQTAWDRLNIWERATQELALATELPAITAN
jgi:hypothetical protein